MTPSGFNKHQTQQLSDMFAHVVDSLDKTIQESENRVTQNLSAKIDKIGSDMTNYISITPTKFQTTNLEKRVQKLETKVFGIPVN